ncbi:MAG: ribosome biogenesis GTPase Der [Deltaproteobacteria bacterium]
MKTIAIVGRPNVGKSTLFNRLSGENQAITDNVSGVTRDRIYNFCEWNGKEFNIIDTGGFVKNSNDVFETEIRDQVEIAIEESDGIIFLTDTTTGITDLDIEIADLLRKSKKTVFLAVNKADNFERLLSANEFWSLGFENTFFLSAITGSGSGELLDAVTDFIGDKEENERDLKKYPKIAVVGQPNVGKSSFINALIGSKRNIVTDIAGTTRDSTHTLYEKFGKEFLIIDTAGIRKKKKVFEDLEFYSVLRAIRSIEDSDVVIIMIDAKMGLESQDMSIIDLATKRKKGIVILINKWDLIEKETNTAKEFETKIKQKLGQFNDIPVLFVSVLNMQRIFKAIEVALDVYERRSQKFNTSELNEFILEAITKIPHPSYRGNYIKIKYASQVPKEYPAFAFFCNYPEEIKTNYRNYLENQLRSHYNLSGIPISIYFRKK